MVAGKRVLPWLFLAFLALVMLVPSASAEATTVCDPEIEVCETPSPEPTGAPSPSESSTPATEPSPTSTASEADPLAGCSEASPCAVEVVLPPGFVEEARDFLTGIALAAAVLVAAALTHLVGSWRR